MVQGLSHSIFLSIINHSFLLQLKKVISIKTSDGSFGVEKGFPYARFLNHEIGMMKESGLVKKVIEKYALEEPDCDTETTSENQVSITFQKVIFPFVIILFGIILSIIFLAVERIK